MDSCVCKTPKELSSAIKNETDTIEVIGDLGKKIVRIKATGKAAWAVCAVALVSAIGLSIAAGASALFPPVSGTSTLAVAASMSPVFGILGTAAGPALAIGVFSGGIGALTTLRNKYKIVKKRENSIILKKK